MIVFYAGFFLICSLICFFDLRYFIIPDILLIALFLWTAVCFFAFDRAVITGRLASAVVLFFIFLFIFKFTRGLGFGVVKFVSCLCFATGFFKALSACFCACLLGLLAFFIARIFYRKIKRLPFAPFLTAGAGISLFSLAGAL